MNKLPVLVVEDDHFLAEAIQDALIDSGFDCDTVGHVDAASQALEHRAYGLIISDLNMPGKNGLSLLSLVSRDYPTIPFIMITAFGTVETALEAIRAGAKDYLLKPFESTVLVNTVEKYGLEADSGNNQWVVADEKSRILFNHARKAAASSASILIMGESGTGKEVLSRYIHEHSPRDKQPFVAINCAAIPDNMIEATLFGYEKGAFTGAHKRFIGKFEQANQGTLLLDEVTEIPIELQAKLLRAIQEQEIERIGGTETIRVDVRLIATSNRNMSEAVKTGEFREDLYYRLNVIRLVCLPLRDRPEDIRALAKASIHQQSEMLKKALILSEAALEKLVKYHWPGNVRELNNVIQRAAVMCENNEIGLNDIQLEESCSLVDTDYKMSFQTNESVLELGEELKTVEYQKILSALKSSSSRKDAAAMLGVSPRTLRYKLAKMREEGIETK